MDRQAHTTNRLSSIVPLVRLLTLRTQARRLASTAFIVCMCLWQLDFVNRDARRSGDIPATRSSGPAAELTRDVTFANLPMAFEPARGQVRGDVRFVARGPGYRVALSGSDATIAWSGTRGDGALRMRYVGALQSPAMSAEGALPEKHHYFTGGTRKPLTNVPAAPIAPTQKSNPAVPLEAAPKTPPTPAPSTPAPKGAQPKQ